VYRKIYIPVDNSDHSNAAIAVGVQLAKTTGAQLIGCHVYAARMHDVRFKQMEYTLPEEYQDEPELERQRRIHDSLITRGLQLISDSYLDVMKAACDAAEVPYEYRTFDGKNWECLVEDIKASDYDLVVMGALGMGAVRDSQVGSVTDRVVRRTRVDTLVVRDTHPFRDDASGRIVVGVDGSPQAFAGLKTALDLGKAFNKDVEAVSVYDPYLHYAMFNGIVDVLSAEASKVFRFKEQEQLHEEIIDTGLAKIYESHLKVAEAVAAEAGVRIKTTLFDGKAFKKVLQYVRQDPPWLLIVGRIGVHSGPTMDIGSNSDNLLRMAPCSLLLSSRTYVPPIDQQAEASVVWTDEGLARMEQVPAAFRAITRTAICRYAMERGHSVISSSIIDQAVGEVMPAHAAQAMGVTVARPAHTMAEAASGETFICRRCGRAARGGRPDACPVCGTADFKRVDKAAISAAAAHERVEEEHAFDGFAVRWTAESKAVLARVPKGYERRRVKARIEKLARVQRLPVISAEFADRNLDEVYAPIAEIVGSTPSPGTPQTLASHEPRGSRGPAGPPTRGRESSNGNGSTPALKWTDEAADRLARVPAGFMRTMARSKVEEFAIKIHADEVSLDVVEGGLADARQMMRGALAGFTPEQVERARQVHGNGNASSPGWTEDGIRRLNEVEITASEKFDPSRAREMAQHAAESRAARTNEAINAAFLERLGIKIGYGHPLSPKTFEHYFTWTPEAEARLAGLPSYCRDLSRWRVEWTAYQKGLGPVITPDVMDTKFDMWGQVSDALQARGPSMPWEEAASERLQHMPDFVRGQVIQAIEGNARDLGAGTVTSAIMDQVIQKWIETGDFHEGRFGFRA
jgi:nucleotide-binding universal stress UspA family protein/ribosomal protein L37E